MSLARVDLGLRVGPGEPGPAPGLLMRALSGVEVTQGDCAPCSFRLTFSTELVDTTTGDFAVVASELLRPFQRVLVRVSVDGVGQTLIDGFITRQEFAPSNAQPPSSFVVSGEDVSVKMDLVDYSREFPSITDDITVLELLAPWALLGIVPDVRPTTLGLVPYDHVPQQAGTDRQTIQQLAAQNGYVFYVTPGPGLFTNVAYWGPPPRDGTPMAVLDVAVGSASSVDAVRFAYDALAPSTYFGYVMETTVDPYIPVPVLTTRSTREPALASRPALDPAALGELSVRRQLWRDPARDPLRANLVAQALTDVSSDAVVTGEVSVTTARLGAVLRAPGLIAVRGAGLDYDGVYYLKRVTHAINLAAGAQWEYRQQLTVTREGVGTTMTKLRNP